MNQPVPGEDLLPENRLRERCERLMAESETQSAEIKQLRRDYAEAREEITALVQILDESGIEWTLPQERAFIDGWMANAYSREEEIGVRCDETEERELAASAFVNRKRSESTKDTSQ